MIQFELPEIQHNQGAFAPSTTLLSRLPKLAEFTPKLELSSESKTNCAQCQKVLRFEKEYFQEIGVCEKCLSIYSSIDLYLNRRSEQKAINIRRQQFIEKLQRRGYDSK